MKKILMFSFIFCSCTTPIVTYQIDHSKKPRTVTTVSEGENAFSIPDRAPDVVSQHPKLTYNYPEKDNPAIYKVLHKVNVRDFPSMKSNIIGTLNKNDTVSGYEIEGDWIRIYSNSYTSIHALKKVSL